MSQKEFTSRVSKAVSELRGRRYHSFDVRVTLEDLERVAEKYGVSVSKLSRYVIVRTRKPKNKIDPNNFVK